MKLAPPLVALTVVFAACADIIGIDDYSLGWECALPTPSAASGSCIQVLGSGSGGGGTGLPSVCNPVNNAGCVAPEVCGPDVDETSYVCSAGGSSASVCGDCSEAVCGPGTVCTLLAGTKRCVQMCCTDTDCGQGQCNPAAVAPKLPLGIGLCTQ